MVIGRCGIAGSRRSRIRSKANHVSSWRRLLPSRVIVQREDLLNPFGAPAAFVVQDFEGLADLFQARIFGDSGGFSSAAYAIENGGQVEKFGASFQKVSVEREGGGQGCDGRCPLRCVHAQDS